MSTPPSLPTDTPATIDVFISHATADDAVVTRIHRALTAAGISAWVDHERGITYGANWDRAIHDAANACTYGLFILSPKSAKSEYCIAEWNRVLALHKKLYIALIEPVPTSEVPLRIGTIQYADLVRDFDEALNELIATMKGQRNLDPQSPNTGQARPLTGPFPRWQLDLPLIGRDDDLKSVQDRLAERHRMVAVLGLGGVGKTRLAAEIASKAPFANGVIWHDLHDYPTLATLTGLIRDHLGLPKTDDDEAVWHAPDRRAVLIVLDNAEDCREPAAFAACLNRLDLDGGTRVLMTSRGEWREVRNVQRYDLQAPSLPAAVAILQAMAEAEPPTFPPGTQAEALATAARRHPRLIRYAVGWLNDYPPEAVLETLRTLKGSNAEEALQDMVNKTVQQVTERPGGSEAIAALRRLVVCRGGFTYHAAQTLVGSQDGPRALAILKQWHLVGVEGGRYDIDPLVSAAVGEDTSAYAVHYDYYLALAEQHKAQQDYLGLDPDSANLESAFERMLATDRAADAYWLANACSDFLANRGRFAQGLNWMERVAAALKDIPDADLRAVLQVSLGFVYQGHPIGDHRANLKRAIAAYREALRFYIPDTAPLDYATTQNNLGRAYGDLAAVEERSANLAKAIAAYHEALRFWTPDTAPLDYALTQNNLGSAYSDLAAVEERAANLARAIAAFTEALRFRTPDTAPLAYALTQNNLGAAYGDLAAVEERAANLEKTIVAYREALRFYTPDTAPLDYALAQRNLGIAQEALGDLAAAVACWREAEKYYRLMDAIEDADLMLTWIAGAEGDA